jgi:hypothetical protein
MDDICYIYHIYLLYLLFLLCFFILIAIPCTHYKLLLWVFKSPSVSETNGAYYMFKASDN